jgi:hypothetical protein
MAKRRRTPRPAVSAATFIGRSRAESSEQKAIWHNKTGAGRSRVIREFFDLNDTDTQALRDGLEQAIAIRLRATQR